MRRVAGLLVLGIIVLSRNVAFADHGSGGCLEDAASNVIYCLGTISTTLPGSSGSSTPGTTIPEADQYVWPVLTTGANGECVRIRTIVAPGGATSQNALDGESLLMTLLQSYPLCAGQQLPPVSPQALADAFWHQVQLPSPLPRIQPGWAITGKTAYLETGATPTKTFGTGTPLGPLAINATSSFVVDWGDGVTNAYTTAGAPWPDGTITHVYDVAGRYDVVVTQQWKATWSIGAAGGTLTALHTVGRIDRFPVRQVQAVRNR